jgi:NAD dependent epimerase/dehydratase
MSSKRVLVTGADGFIGSHLTEYLVRAGHEVCAFVLYNSFNSWGWLDQAPKDVRDAIEVFPGDVRDPYGIKRAMTGREWVFNLAALITIPHSYHSPDSYVDTNIKGCLNVVNAARELGTEKVIQTSTSEVYGTALSVPIDETHRLHGQSPYSASKIGADQIALSFYMSFGTPVTVVRPFNTYGPRQSSRAFIPSIVTQIAAGGSAVKVGALHPTRDFSHVSDIVRGFDAAAKTTDSLGEVINLGSGFEISMQDTAMLIADIMGATITLVSDEERIRPKDSEVERLFANNSKASNLLGWSPHFGGRAGFKQGLEQTIPWFTDARNLRAYKINRYNI